MAAPTYSDFASRFTLETDLLSSGDSGVETALTARLSFWWTRHNVSLWGDDRTEAVLLRVAHERQMQLDRKSGNRSSGRVQTGEAVGQWSRSWSGSSSADPERMLLQQTDWGQQYLHLQMGLATLPVFSGM